MWYDKYRNDWMTCAFIAVSVRTFIELYLFLKASADDQCSVYFFDCILILSATMLNVVPSSQKYVECLRYFGNYFQPYKLTNKIANIKYAENLLTSAVGCVGRDTARRTH